MKKRCILLLLSQLIVPVLSYAEAPQDVDIDIELSQRLLERRDSMQKLLSVIDTKYAETTDLLNKIQLKIEQKRSSLDALSKEMDSYQDEIDHLSKELGAQIRLAYILGHKEKLKLILNQNDHALSSRVMVYFNYFNKERLDKFSEIQIAMDHLEALDKLRQAESAALADDLQRKKAEQVLLVDARKQRNELLAKISHDSASQQQKIFDLQESEASLRQLMLGLPVDNVDLSDHQEPAAGLSVSNQGDSIDSTDFISLKGKLLWPVTGHLVNKFGSARTEVKWDGVLIEANEGLDVKAVARGKVVFAEWFRGYGFMIIINHGDGYLSLYGFNQKLNKQGGQLVEAGDVIASVGQSGGQSRSGLYFGIRHKGVPIDPLEWCRR